MIAVAVGIVLFVVAAGAAWARFGAARAEKRSLDTYERTLDLLGGVAKRSDAVADIHAPTDAELARPHVRPAIGHDFPSPARSAVRIVPPARVRLEPPVLPGHPAASMPVFGEGDLGGDDVPAHPITEVAPPAALNWTDDLQEDLQQVAAETTPVEVQGIESEPVEPETTVIPVVGAPLVPVAVAPDVVPSLFEPLTEVFARVLPSDESVEVVGGSSGELDEVVFDVEEEPDLPALVFDFDDEATTAGTVVGKGRLELARAGRLPDHRTMRRAATGAAAAVVVGAIAVGGWQLASRSGPPSASPPTATTIAPSTGHSHGTGHTAPTTAPAATPTTLQPTSTSAALVTYTAPSGSYTISLTATSGTCWLGAQQQVNTTAYLAMWTLAPGQTATYHASGAVVIKIGAPKYVTIEVNGRRVDLPPGNIQAYDIRFATGAGTSV